MKSNPKKNQSIFRGTQKEKKLPTKLGKNARATFNHQSKIPRHVVQIDTYPTSLKKGKVPVTNDNVEQSFREFLTENKDFFGVETKNLKKISAQKVNKRWLLKFEQEYKGIPVYKASVGIESTEDGKVSTFAANYYADIKLNPKPKLKLADASKTALNSYDSGVRPTLKILDDKLIVYPVKKEKQTTYHLAWKFLVAGEAHKPELEKHFIIDANDGTILDSFAARFPGARVMGTVQAEIYPMNSTDPVTTVPLEHEHVFIEDAGTATTNNLGVYKKSVNWFWMFANFPNGEARFRLEGPYARVQDVDGSDYTETRPCNTSTPCDLTWTATDRDHINVFYHINLFHDWLKDELGYSWVNPWDGTSRFNARVNLPDSNAWAGDPMLFGTSAYARNCDVIYHECTHNILFHIYGDWIGWPSKYIEAYAMDEGFADYFACTCINQSQTLSRDLDNNRQYPGKSSYNSEGHTGGTIIGGAAWQLRQRLVSIYGITGARIADQLILEAHQILSTYPRDYYFSDPNESNLLTALYKAADTDNNLLNGFPYFNDIQHAFHAHSLLQAVLHDKDSYDFSTNNLGTLTGGDLYYSGGKFWANNYKQKGVLSLGNIGDADLASVSIPTSGYTRFGVEAVEGHTYISKAQQGEEGSYIVFRVDDISTDGSEITINYFYRMTPYWYIANLNTREIHKPNCNWVSLMANSNKYTCKSLDKVADLIENDGYNGCHFCMPRYDTDTLSLNKVLENLEEDLG